MQRENLEKTFFAAEGCPPVRWRIAPSPVDYADAVETMEREAAAIAAGEADELVWLVEHPPLYTAGTSADAADLVMPGRFPGVSDRPRRRIYLSWPRAARGLRHA